MSRTVFIIDDGAEFPYPGPGREAVSAHDYLMRAKPYAKRTRVVNLCSDYSYLGLGYYCALTAEARGDRILPSAEAMLWVGWKRIYRRALGDMERQLTKALRRSPDPEDAPGGPVTVCFGVCAENRFQHLARAVFDAFRCPILRVHYERAETAGGEVVYRITDVRVPNWKKLPAADRVLFEKGLDAYTKRHRPTPALARGPRYTLAVLVDPKEAMPPSSPQAIERIVRVGASMGVKVETIGRRDLPRLAEFDALFIRETTALDHHTYRFAKRAETEGIPCIDDAMSILRCTNKVYLAELFRTNNIPSPRTRVIDKDNLEQVAQETAYPIVLKVPDGAFSRGVKRADDAGQMIALGREMLSRSALILSQEYLRTEYDWRIGILNGAPIFASKYFMARGHWQIINHAAKGAPDEGGFETVDLDAVPSAILDAALAAARPIGDGLYGVDTKLIGDRAVVIEVNDNPNLDAGVEDKVLKDGLWRTIVSDFIRRIEAAR
ncbi:MAG: RimK family protein [Pseudomonadota bacterium]|nr:RimK family protein [Pseudomonadota bacterium]